MGQVHLGVDLDSKVIIVGPNGAGRFTVLLLIIGDLGDVDSSPIAREW